MKNVLIVEDHPDALTVMRSIVADIFPAARTQDAGDCREALALVETNTFNLALVDLHLPDGSGLEVIGRLNARTPQTRIVVSSIYGDDGHLFPALQAGAHGYLLKDDPRDSLVRQLAGMLDGTPPLSPAIARKLIRHFTAVPSAGPRSEHNLTPREQEALGLLAQGISVKHVAQSMGISPHTAGDYVKSIYRKLNITSRAEAAIKATEFGLVGHR